MKRSSWVFALMALVLAIGDVPARAVDTQTGYCATNGASPECYCQLHKDELKCLTYQGANPGFFPGGTGKSASSSTTAAPSRPPSTFSLFVHYGNAEGKSADVALLIQKLRDKGYVVKGADSDTIAIDGARVDFFDDKDEDVAEEIAGLVKETLNLARVPHQRRHVSNPTGYIGIWLYGTGKPQ